MITKHFLYQKCIGWGPRGTGRDCKQGDGGISQQHHHNHQLLLSASVTTNISINNFSFEKQKDQYDKQHSATSLQHPSSTTASLAMYDILLQIHIQFLRQRDLSFVPWQFLLGIQTVLTKAHFTGGDQTTGVSNCWRWRQMQSTQTLFDYRVNRLFPETKEAEKT